MRDDEGWVVERTGAEGRLVEQGDKRTGNAAAAIERALRAAHASGVPRVDLDAIVDRASVGQPDRAMLRNVVADLAGDVEPAGGDVVPLRAGDERVRSWFDSAGWELEPDALASALRMLGADDSTGTLLQAESVAKRGLPANAGRYIVIPNWSGPDGFQHYRDRDPVWIKNYRTLLSNDEYLSLSGHRRGILHGLWLEYAASGCCIRVDTKMIGRRLGLVVKTADLEALKAQGFIQFALAPRKHAASPEVEVDKELPISLTGTPANNSPREPSKRAHGDTAQAQPLTCPIDYCGLPFKNKARLDDHLANVHDQPPTT